MANIVSPIFSSVETLVADVQNVTSSELSLRQLAALIEDEFRSESQHMETERGRKNYKKEKKCLEYNTLSIWLSIAKWVAGIIFIIVLAAILAPERVGDSFNKFENFITTKGGSDSAPKKYSLSNVDWYFSLLQLLRRSSTSFKIEGMFPITDHDIDACIVDNPLFKPEKIRCSACRDIIGFYDVMDGSSFNHPMLKEKQDISFSLGRLQQVFSKNGLMVNQHTISIITNCTYIKTVEDLKKNHVLERLEKDDMSHVAGTAVSYMSAHVLRKEFPRPQGFISHAAQTYKNYFYIDGIDSAPYVLQTSISDSNFMYIQSTGSRQLVFSPPNHCRKKCHSFSRVMMPGDIVFYSSMWSILSEPFSDAKSLAFVDNFEWLSGAS